MVEFVWPARLPAEHVALQIGCQSSQFEVTLAYEGNAASLQTPLFIEHTRRFGSREAGAFQPVLGKATRPFGRPPAVRNWNYSPEARGAFQTIPQSRCASQRSSEAWWSLSWVPWPSGLDNVPRWPELCAASAVRFCSCFVAVFARHRGASLVSGLAEIGSIPGTQAECGSRQANLFLSHEDVWRFPAFLVHQRFEGAAEPEGHFDNCVALGWGQKGVPARIRCVGSQAIVTD